jgi:hypothetical protein
MKRLTAVLNPLAIALATATVVAAPAVARPADRIDRFPGNGANVTPIPHFAPDVKPPNIAHPWPVEPVATPVAPTGTDAGDDDVALLIGLGLAGAGVAAGAVGIVRGRRVAA